jgi:hypothetical protein
MQIFSMLQEKIGITSLVPTFQVCHLHLSYSSFADSTVIARNDFVCFTIRSFLLDISTSSLTNNSLESTDNTLYSRPQCPPGHGPSL